MSLATGRSMVRSHKDEELAAFLDALKDKNGKSFESSFDNFHEGKGKPFSYRFDNSEGIKKPVSFRFDDHDKDKRKPISFGFDSVHAGIRNVLVSSKDNLFNNDRMNVTAELILNKKYRLVIAQVFFRSRDIDLLVIVVTLIFDYSWFLF